MKISVIMPVYLGDFEGAAKNRTQKFIRAVRSFMAQTHKDKELIVIADGDPSVAKTIKNHFSGGLANGLIKIVEHKEHRGFVGAVRQSGIDVATGRVCLNLDSDDELLSHHLANVDATFDPEKYEWAYFNFYRKLDELKNIEEHVIARPDLEGLCTANVVWRKDLDATWNGCDGRQDNKSFNKQLIQKHPNFHKIFGCGYVVHHAVIAGATV